MITALIVDSHPLVCDATQIALDESECIRVIGKAYNQETALRAYRECLPQMLLIALELTGFSTLLITRRILSFDKRAKILGAFHTYNNVLCRQFLQAGGLGCIDKSSSLATLVQAMKTVIDGRCYLADHLAQSMALSRFNPDADKTPFDILTAREFELMLMLVNGQTLHKIGQDTHLSPKTLMSYRFRIFQKLNVRSDVAMLHLAARYQLIEIEPLSIRSA